MTITKFEDLVAWQKAQELAVHVYQLSRDFDDYSFRNQIQRAAVSISNNIAEGFNRTSNAEFRKFLFYSKGSCSEVKSMIYLAVRLGFISDRQQNEMLERCDQVFKIIKGLIRHLNSKL